VDNKAENRYDKDIEFAIGGLSMFWAICIKKCDQFNKGEVVKAWQGFGKIYFFRGFKFGLNMSKERFEEHFTIFRNYYIVEKPPIKKRFRKPKPCYLRVEFKDISEALLVDLYNYVFSYLELTKQISPELIQSFNYSIISTLEKLEFLYTVLPEEKYLEAIKDAEQVFLGIYKTALSIELEALPKMEDYNQLLENFKQENMIIGSFFKQLNE